MSERLLPKIISKTPGLETERVYSQRKRQVSERKETEKKKTRGEAYDINKQRIIYSTEIKNQIKGALCPGAHTG